MSIFDDSNVFATRRSCGALTLLSQAPVASQSPGVVDIPHVAPLHVIEQHSRELYRNYPGDIARKIRTDEPEEPNGESSARTRNSGLLTLKVTSDVRAALCSGQIDIADYDNSLVVLFYVEEMVFRSDYWSGGDNQHYDSITFYWNVETDDPDLPWLVYETNVSRSPNSQFGVVISQDSNPSTTPNTSGAASLFNGGTSPSGQPFNASQLYAVFSTKVAYTELIEGGENYLLDSRLKVRHEDQPDPQGLATFATMAPNIFDLPGWAGADPGFVSAPDFPIWSDIPYTFTPDDATWIGSWTACSVTAKCQFSYTAPDSCDRRWWPGTKVKLKVTYKKAEVIRTFGPGPGTLSNVSGYYSTLADWEDAGDEEIEVTLPDDSSTPQLIGDQWDLEEIDGYVVAIDDIEIIEVT